MKNKFNGNITLRELIEICERTKSHGRSGKSYVYLSCYSEKTRKSLVNYKKNILLWGSWSLLLEEEPGPDNQISVERSDVGLIKVEWYFSEQQKDIYGVANQYHYKFFARAKSGNLEPIGEAALEFSLLLDEPLLLREKGECVTLKVDQTPVNSAEEFQLCDVDQGDSGWDLAEIVGGREWLTDDEAGR